jgi:hypothetical protein
MRLATREVSWVGWWAAYVLLCALLAALMKDKEK